MAIDDLLMIGIYDYNGSVAHLNKLSTFWERRSNMNGTMQMCSCFFLCLMMITKLNIRNGIFGNILIYKNDKESKCKR